MKKHLILLTLISSLVMTTPVVAQDTSRDLAIVEGSIRVTKDILVNETVRIYATVQNNSDQDLLGTVRFYDETVDAFIGSDQPVSIIGGGTDDVFVDWSWEELGNKTVTARVFPWEDDGDNPNNNKTNGTFYVDIDSDGDGTPDAKDSDDDNDGVSDGEDAFPLDASESADWDEDGIGDNADEDDDNDGVPDVEDVFTRDPNETKDADADGVGDNADVFPNDPTESVDEDGDGLGANVDPNDQNLGPVAVIAYLDKKRGDQKLVTGSPVVFDASNSTDPDGEVERYVWVFSDEFTEEGAVMERTFETAGEYAVRLRVFDDKGEYREMDMMFEVAERGRWWGLALVGAGVILVISISGWLWRRGQSKKK